MTDNLELPEYFCPETLRQQHQVLAYHQQLLAEERTRPIPDLVVVAYLQHEIEKGQRIIAGLQALAKWRALA